MNNTLRNPKNFPRVGRGALALAALGLVLASGPGAGPAPANLIEAPSGAFTVEQETVVPVSPETAYDAMTGDISGWWDHTMSENPQALTIEPKPGGRFVEVFDETGDGALHGTVIYAERGKRLRFEGPLGFSGSALDLVVTYEFVAEGDGTRITVTCNGAGQLEEGWAEAVDRVWHHFLIERFKPYVESGAHLEKE